MRCASICDAIANELATAHLLVATASAIRSIANLRDFETGMHLTRMAELSRLIARNLPAHFGLTDEDIEHIYLFSPLHDIGKIGIPDAILLKAGRLTDSERQTMQTHVQKGVDMIDSILADFNLIEANDARIMRNIIAFHHEYLDGSGDIELYNLASDPAETKNLYLEEPGIVKRLQDELVRVRSGP